MELLISFIITWGWGLLIPALIRFVIVRKPMSKGVAISFSIYWVIQNVLIWTAIGIALGEPTSKTHGVQYIIGFVVYYMWTYSPKKVVEDHQVVQETNDFSEPNTNSSLITAAKQILILFLIGFLIIFGLFLLGRMESSSKQEEGANNIEIIDEQLRKLTEEEAENLPIKTSNTTMLTSMFYMTGQMNMGVVLFDFDETTFSRQDFENRSRVLIKDVLCNDPTMEILRSRGEYSIHYRYYNESGSKQIAYVTLSQEDCAV